jgi:transcriptional regulator with XRE-family HTH domain
MTQINSLGDFDADRLLRDFTAAALIFAARSDAGLTQQQMADAVGTNRELIAKLENGDSLGIDRDLLARIAHRLKIEL